QNLVSDKGAQSIGTFVSNCTELTTLYIHLNENNIKDDGANALGVGLNNCKMLEDLQFSLWGNFIREKGVKIFESSLNSCKQIQNVEFIISNNQIGDDGIVAIISGFASCKFIKKLKIHFIQNNISDKGISSLGDMLKNLGQLTYLSIKINDYIGDFGAKELSDGLSFCKELTSLTLEIINANISDKGATDIAVGFSKCAQLSYLRLYIKNKYNNLISDIFYYQFATVLQNLAKLTTLDLRFIKYSKILKQKEIINCRNIKTIILDCYYLEKKKIIKQLRLASKIKRLIQLQIRQY
ncbi:hypothetical protein ABPG74_002707, partial [Tetrahymena malaccensis]